MKTKLFSGLIIICIGLLIHPRCKTSKESYSIIGTWTVIMEITNGPQRIETLTFSGSDTNGQITGWSHEYSQIGTYTVYDDSTVLFTFDYLSPYYGQTLIVFNGVLTSNTSMEGTGTWYDDDLGNTYNHTWTATKL
jgi:hypothetical protein